jgi:hypothetical protein
MSALLDGTIPGCLRKGAIRFRIPEPSTAGGPADGIRDRITEALARERGNTLYKEAQTTPHLTWATVFTPYLRRCWRNALLANLLRWTNKQNVLSLFFPSSIDQQL